MGLDTLASRINNVVILVLVGCWFVELFSSGWHQKVSLLYEIDVGLMGVEINHGVALKAMDLAIRGLTPGAADALADVVVGKYSVTEASEYLCAVSQNFAPGVNGCEIWSQINTASRIMQCTIITGIILLLLGAAFHYHYWNVSPRKKTRMWTRGFLISAPAIIMTGFLIYYSLTKNLANFPPRSVETFGYCYVFGLWLCMWTCVPIFVHEQFAMQHGSEVMIEETKKAQKEKSFQNYGAAQQHSGYAPPQQQQYAPQAGYQQQPQYAPQFPPGSYEPQSGWSTESGYGYGGPMAFGGATPQGGASPRTYAALQGQQGGACGPAPGAYGAEPHLSGTLRTSSTSQAQAPAASSGALRTSSTSQAQAPGPVPSSMFTHAGNPEHAAHSPAPGPVPSSMFTHAGNAEQAATSPGEAEASSNSSDDGSDSSGGSQAGRKGAAAPATEIASGDGHAVLR